MARTVQVLAVLFTEEQLKGDGETPRRPGGSGRGGEWGWTDTLRSLY